MESILILIPIAILIIAIAIVIFFWAVKSGQFEDLDTEGKRILFDSEPQTTKKQNDLRDKGDAKHNHAKHNHAIEQAHQSGQDKP